MEAQLLENEKQILKIKASKGLLWFGIISIGAELLNLGVTEVIRRRLDTNSHRAVANLLFVFNASLVASILLFGLASNFWVALVALWCADVFRFVQELIFRTWQNLECLRIGEIVTVTSPGVGERQCAVAQVTAGAPANAPG